MQTNMQQLVLNPEYGVRESHGDVFSRLGYGEIRPGVHFDEFMKAAAGLDIRSLGEPVLSSGKTISKEILLERPDRERVWLLFTLEPFVRSHKIVGVMVHVQNITLQKQDAEQAGLTDKLMQMTWFSRNLLEKISQPLTTVLNRMGGLLLDQEWADHRNELEQLQSLIYKLSLVTQALEGFVVEPRLHNKVVDVQSTLEKSIDLTGMLFPQSRLRFELLPIQEKARIRGNEVTLEQCFIHVLRNAAESMPNGGVVKIALRLDQGNGLVHVDIADQGIGMSAREIAQACEPFFKKKRGDHLGLGLAISCLILLAHHGFIQFKSTPESGTTVTITLPLQQGHSL